MSGLLGIGDVAAVHDCPMPALTAASGAARRAPGAAAASVAGSRRRYAARGSSTTPRLARCGVDHCTSTSRSGACSSPSPRTSATSATFEASRSRWNIDSPANRPADRHAVQAADQPAVAPGLDRVRPAQLVQPPVGRADVVVDPARTRAPGPRSPPTTSSNAVSTRISKSRSERRSERETTRPSTAAPRGAPGRTSTSGRPACPTASGTARGGTPPAGSPARGRRRSRPGRRGRRSSDGSPKDQAEGAGSTGFGGSARRSCGHGSTLGHGATVGATRRLDGMSREGQHRPAPRPAGRPGSHPS